MSITKLRVVSNSGYTIEPGRVLVVDDHRQARESVADILRVGGHQVASVSSGVEARACSMKSRSTWWLPTCKCPA